ncbi:hypothetical protein B0H13DRAFT_1851448 [Mycena leptocephala]|nr:hypothetical protein B0H13DRAFT_1851448 [Mycena leptocephala]
MNPKPVPEGLALKCKRDNTAGGSVTTATFYSDAPSKSAKPSEPSATSSDTIYGAIWQCIHNDLVAANKPIPPPAVVPQYCDLHLKSLSDYKGAQLALQKAVKTNETFVHSASNGAIPALISNHLKLPTYQLVKSTTGVDSDPRVVAALESANTDLPLPHASPRAKINAGACAGLFAAEPTAYSEQIICQAGSDDIKRWDQLYLNVDRLQIPMVVLNAPDVPRCNLGSHLVNWVILLSGTCFWMKVEVNMHELLRCGNIGRFLYHMLPPKQCIVEFNSLRADFAAQGIGDPD